MQWRPAGFAASISRISVRTWLPGAGIRPTAWLGISVRTRLPRAGIRPTASVKPAIRAGQWQHTLILRELLVVLVLLFAAGVRAAEGHRAVAAGRTVGGRAAIMAEVLQCHVFARSDFAMGGGHGGAPRGPIAGGLHGGGAPHFAMGGPHGGGEPRGTPLRLGTRSRHGRRAPRGAPLHGGRQRQIRGAVPSHGARVLEVRIHLPPGALREKGAVARKCQNLHENAVDRSSSSSRANPAFGSGMRCRNGLVHKTSRKSSHRTSMPISVALT
jgi:hypothetical protein